MENNSFIAGLQELSDSYHDHSDSDYTEFIKNCEYDEFIRHHENNLGNQKIARHISPKRGTYVWTPGENKFFPKTKTLSVQDVATLEMDTFTYWLNEASIEELDKFAKYSFKDDPWENKKKLKVKDFLKKLLCLWAFVLPSRYTMPDSLGTIQKNKREVYKAPTTSTTSVSYVVPWALHYVNGYWYVEPEIPPTSEPSGTSIVKIHIYFPISSKLAEYVAHIPIKDFWGREFDYSWRKEGSIEPGWIPVKVVFEQ